MMVGERAMHIF